MPALIDLTGSEWAGKFGKWTVLRLDVDATRPGAWWVCRCDPARGGCGAEVSVVGQSLREGRSTECRACANARMGPNLGDHTRAGRRLSAAHRAAIAAAQQGRTRPSTRGQNPSQRSREIAAAVLDEARPQVDVAREYGLTKQRVSQIVAAERKRREP